MKREKNPTNRVNRGGKPTSRMNAAEVRAVCQFHRHKAAVKGLKPESLSGALHIVQTQHSETQEEAEWLINRELAILEEMAKHQMGPFSSPKNKPGVSGE